MRKIIVLLLFVSTYSNAQTKIWGTGTSDPDEESINAAATEYIIIFNPVDGILRTIGNTNPDFILTPQSGAPGAGVTIRVRGIGG